MLLDKVNPSCIYLTTVVVNFCGVQHQTNSVCGQWWVCRPGSESPLNGSFDEKSAQLSDFRLCLVADDMWRGPFFVGPVLKELLSRLVLGGAMVVPFCCCFLIMCSYMYFTCTDELVALMGMFKPTWE